MQIRLKYEQTVMSQRASFQSDIELLRRQNEELTRKLRETQERQSVSEEDASRLSEVLSTTRSKSEAEIQHFLYVFVKFNITFCLSCFFL